MNYLTAKTARPRLHGLPGGTAPSLPYANAEEALAAMRADAKLVNSQPNISIVNAPDIDRASPKLVLKALRSRDMTNNELIAETGLAPPTVRATRGRLEAQGLVKMTGTKISEANRTVKMWGLTAAGKAQAA